MQCVRCNQITPDTKERTVTKPTGEAKRVLCDACAAAINDVYPVQGSRKSAPEPVEDAPPAVKSTSTSKFKRGLKA
jgi:hypothetical protein